MSERLVSVTPISQSWPHGAVELARGIQVIERPSFREADWRFWNLRRTEEEMVLHRSHWLRAERECKWIDHAAFEEMANDLRSAMLAFQLWSPIGWQGLILDCRRSAAGNLTVERVSLPEHYYVPEWAWQLDIRKLDTAQLGLIVEGTLAAVESGCVPIVNPFRFLEIGLQTAVNHPRAGSVLWMMGLDGLLAAEKKEVFSTRLQRLLGKDTLIFPKDRVGNQLSYTVGELAPDMFEFRNLIAHGKEILQKYREPRPLQTERGHLHGGLGEEWSRGTLMIESIIFSLIAALRTAIIGGLTERMKDQRAWRRWLDSPSANEVRALPRAADPE